MGVGLVLGEIRSRDEREGFPGSASRAIGMEESRRGVARGRGVGQGRHGPGLLVAGRTPDWRDGARGTACPHPCPVLSGWW